DGPDRQAGTYVAFYAGEKQLWDAFFKRYPTKKEDIDNADPMYVKDGTLYGGYGVTSVAWHLWRTLGRATWSGNNNDVLTVTAE
ncbi:MAG: hypothetical protein QHH75_15410, partial [Bacillota bacterium]|nr:hypothetical protein [Bacillota bacterium]